MIASDHFNMVYGKEVVSKEIRRRWPKARFLVPKQSLGTRFCYFLVSLAKTFLL